MFKNLSPSRLTLYIAVLVSICNIAIQYLFSTINGINFNLGLLLISAIASFIICYFIVRYFIAKYLIKKIRLIYNIIQRSKFGKSSTIKLQKGLLAGNVWQSVEADVAKWANVTETEIENLKELEQYRKDFVGNISHELRTPIFTIQGYIHTLLEGGLEDDNVNVHFLDRAANNVSRLINIVDDLEIISNLEAGSDTLVQEDFDLKLLTEEVIDDLAVQAKQHDIELVYNEKAPNYIVRGDREKFRQVYNNLIYNSIKYGKPNGRTKIKFLDLDQYILVEVSDNGIGMEEKHLNHVFDRFYRIDKSRSRDVGGSGLGLSIVKHIVEAHDQTINVRSTLGEGSTFGFTIEKVKK
ncbi:sensor histidine kinase [Portibacter lacus]|uniref:histidine kinase n=1 Tax=Portibacter lacus TaxID=1099794 RepID=A0AA37SP87_9BACT|nr:ATP-binding protein [Portibacter lacus]GLR17447.1 two-component sensor histidine kinase [Portibacter lacus]